MTVFETSFKGCQKIFLKKVKIMLDKGKKMWYIK